MYYFFAWETSKECILTIDNLRKWGKILVNASYFCKRTEESCNLVFLWCLVVHQLWVMLYGLISISWVMADLVIDMRFGLGGASEGGVN